MGSTLPVVVDPGKAVARVAGQGRQPVGEPRWPAPARADSLTLSDARPGVATLTRRGGRGAHDPLFVQQTGYEAEAWEREIAGAAGPGWRFDPLTAVATSIHGAARAPSSWTELYFANDPALLRLYRELQAALRSTGAQVFVVERLYPVPSRVPASAARLQGPAHR